MVPSREEQEEHRRRKIKIPTLGIMEILSGVKVRNPIALICILDAQLGKLEFSKSNKGIQTERDTPKQQPFR